MFINQYCFFKIEELFSIKVQFSIVLYWGREWVKERKWRGKNRENGGKKIFFYELQWKVTLKGMNIIEMYFRYVMKIYLGDSKIIQLLRV